MDSMYCIDPYMCICVCIYIDRNDNERKWGQFLKGIEDTWELEGE